MLNRLNLVFTPLNVEFKKEGNKHNTARWKNFRKKMFSHQRTKFNGKLHCWFCDKTLQTKTPNIENFATLDHLIPQSKGGKKYDVNNVVVSCFECNNKKGSLSLSQFRCTPYYQSNILSKIEINVE